MANWGKTNYTEIYSINGNELLILDNGTDTVVCATNLFQKTSEALNLGETSSTAYRGDRGKIAYDHSQSAHLSLGETSSTAYRGDFGKVAYDHSQIAHNKALVGLSNVDNTSDANKPISSAAETRFVALESQTDQTTLVDFTISSPASSWTFSSLNLTNAKRVEIWFSGVFISSSSYLKLGNLQISNSTTLFKGHLVIDMLSGIANAFLGPSSVTPIVGSNTDHLVTNASTSINISVNGGINAIAGRIIIYKFLK